MSTSFLYAGKERRFGSAIAAIVKSMNNASMTAYQSTVDPDNLCDNANSILKQKNSINHYVASNLCGKSDTCFELSAYARAIKDYLNDIFQYNIAYHAFPTATQLMNMLPVVLQQKGGKPVKRIILSTSPDFIINLFYQGSETDKEECNITLLSGSQITNWQNILNVSVITPNLSVAQNRITSSFSLNLYVDKNNTPAMVDIGGSTNCWPINKCPPEVTLCSPIRKLPDYAYINNCVDGLLATARSNAAHRYQNWVDSSKNDLLQRYYAKCLKAVEVFTMTYTDREYQYTLYYYDQAGNLVKTVPPSGVNLLSPGMVEKVADSRAKRYSTAVLPKHVKPTVYRFNTVNQPVWQKTPDAGESDFYYDGLARVVASQNAQQKSEGTFSYIKYDPLGRIVESGKVQTSAITVARTRDFEGWTSFIDNQPGRSEITLTCYDQSYSAATNKKFGAAGQRNLRKRVASVLSFENTTKLAGKSYNYATHYTYDIMGNVYKLIQDYPNGIIGDKILEYDYDLQSGKVNSLSYQPGGPDQFLHRYSYDAANRLVRVETSTGGLVWETDAEYFYYRHGLLARLELGTDKVQGLDYLYTLQGFIKGINGTTTSAATDMGQDGIITPAPLGGTQTETPPQSVTLFGNTIYLYNTAQLLGAGFNGPGYGTMHNPVARDAFGYVLEYYDKDYMPVKGNTCLDALLQKQAGTVKPLYNGNISRMYTQLQNFGNPALQNLGNMGFNYRYDQLNRITSQQGWNLGGNNMTDLSLLPNDVYGMKLKYDADGNILRMKRNGGFQQPDMDSLSYRYYLQNGGMYNPENGIPATATNKLAFVKDSVPAGNYAEDLDDQNSNNYEYNIIGNLLSDKAGNIKQIDWDLQKKVTRISKTDGTLINYTYDALGNRVMKEVSGGPKPGGKTFYVRDGKGNIQSIYTWQVQPKGGKTLLTWDEAHIYGSSRIGLFKPQRVIPEMTASGGATEGPENTPTSAGSAIITAHTNLFGNLIYRNGVTVSSSRPMLSATEASDSISRGYKLYELTNHLGNVLATITDRKIPYDDGSYLNGKKQNDTKDNVADYYIADVASSQDYYAFGMEMPGRKINSSTYKFGFNDKLKDDEVYGEGNFQDYGFRMYDSRVCRFISIDPLTKKYPELTPYQFASNTPIMGVDLDGLELSTVSNSNNSTINSSLVSTEGNKSGGMFDIGGGQYVNGPFANADAARSSVFSLNTVVQLSEFEVKSDAWFEKVTETKSMSMHYYDGVSKMKFNNHDEIIQYLERQKEHFNSLSKKSDNISWVTGLGTEGLLIAAGASTVSTVPSLIIASTVGAVNQIKSWEFGNNAAAFDKLLSQYNSDYLEWAKDLFKAGYVNNLPKGGLFVVVTTHLDTSNPEKTLATSKYEFYRPCGDLYGVINVTY